MMHSFFDRILSPEEVSAHCDVPCGIYDPHGAELAAYTVETMVKKLLDLKQPSKDADTQMQLAYQNTVTRMIWTKEEHARLCKSELLLLWTDYFKPEHLEMFPQLHETFWKAAKLCSKNKQEVNLEAAGQLREAVHEIAHLFEKAEAAKTKKA